MAFSNSVPTGSDCPRHILEYILQIKLQNSFKLVSIEPAKSAQQQVWILRLEQVHISVDVASSSIEDEDWKEALQTGRQRLVVRQWKGGCRWWNLNRNASPTTLATSEIFGYGCARNALADETVTIPRVLHHDTDTDGPPWAILEYVGPESIYFDNFSYDSYYLDGMVKIRKEFGFDEPHPRWGRVPVEESANYAIMVLDQVVIPLHLASKETVSAEMQSRQVHTYRSMVAEYQTTWNDLKAAARVQDDRMMQALQLVDNAVNHVLPTIAVSIPPMPPVLVHLDLQPQNLLFACKHDNVDDGYMISSVLDWEDAAVADPRFDLLLICRKVLPDLEQSHSLWKRYAEAWERSTVIGSILPWLQLETIHSILTLLMQSMDLLNGGRNPWETNKDLWGKLQREFVRWEEWCGE